jgi:hypothetical protein
MSRLSSNFTSSSHKLISKNSDHVVIGGFYTSGEIVIAGLNDYLPDARPVAVPAGPLCANGGIERT